MDNTYATPPAPTYPTDVEVDTPEMIDRWRPLLQWIMAFPHLLLLSALGSLLNVVSFVAWLVIVFTGSMPRGLAQLTEMYMRYNTRVFAYVAALVTEYPPFAFPDSFEDPRSYPARQWAEPALENRNRLTVGLRVIWVIPAAIFAGVIVFIGSLAGFIGAIGVVVTGSWDESLRGWVMNALRVTNRLYVYGLLLTDEYPPFSVE